jgi:hypothetical protein
LCFNYNWVCAPPPSDARCPGEIPQLGGGCADQGLDCNYGCQDPMHVQCNNGAWEMVRDSCG